MHKEYDIVVIGAGAAGLSVAAASAQLGAKVLIVEKAAQMGGDCLHFGCVPSKTLLHSAKIAHTVAEAKNYGITTSQPASDLKAVLKRVHEVIAAIQPHDSVKRFEKLGCDVLVNSTGKFLGRKTFLITEGRKKGTRVTARTFVIATGSRPLIPQIPGLSDVPFLTNETVFSLKEKPKHLLIIGGGPIGSEMAQAFCRLGSKVTIAIGTKETILHKDDPDAAKLVMKKMAAEGVQFLPFSTVEKIGLEKNGLIQIHITSTKNSKKKTIHTGDKLLIATGRMPNVEKLGLDAAGVQYSERGIITNEKLQTTAKNIYACGDITGLHLFTHMAGYHAGIILRNIFSPLPLTKISTKNIAWVTYTDPELAQVGLSEKAAQEKNIRHKVYRFDFSGNDRARAQNTSDGFIKVICDHKNSVLGATIVGHNAGELLGTWGLAITQNLKIGDMLGPIFPYPTLGEVSKQVALQSLKEKLTPWKKMLLKKIFRLRGKS